MIFGLNSWLFWLILTAVLVVIEIVTTNLVTIWFAGGCLASVVVSLLGGSVELQLIVAVAVSLVLLAACLIFKPFDKFKKNEHLPTNADRVVGKTGIALEKIDSQSGLVKILGQTWSAITLDGTTIDMEENVRVINIEGVKLIVERSE